MSLKVSQGSPGIPKLHMENYLSNYNDHKILLGFRSVQVIDFQVVHARTADFSLRVGPALVRMGFFIYYLPCLCLNKELFGVILQIDSYQHLHLRDDRARELELLMIEFSNCTSLLEASKEERTSQENLSQPGHQPSGSKQGKVTDIQIFWGLHYSSQLRLRLVTESDLNKNKTYFQ